MRAVGAANRIAENAKADQAAAEKARDEALKKMGEMEIALKALMRGASS